MDRLRSPLYTDNQICCLEGCWPASEQSQVLPQVPDATGKRQNNHPSPVAQQRTRNPWKSLGSVAPVIIGFDSKQRSPSPAQQSTPKRETSANTRSNLIHSLAASVRRGNSSSNRTVNTNLLKSTKKPSIGSSIGKQGTKQPWSAPKRLTLEGKSTIELERSRQNVRTEPFWNVASFFSKYSKQLTEYSSGQLPVERLWENETTTKSIEHSQNHIRILQTKNTVQEVKLQQLRIDSNNQTAANSHVLHSPMQVGQKRSREDLHTTPQSRYGERSENEEEEYLLIPQKEKIRVQKLWTLSAKEAESDGDSALWQTRQQQQHRPEQRPQVQVLGDLFIREVSESRQEVNHDSNDKEEEEPKNIIKRTHTLPTASLLGEHRPRASHQVNIESFRVDSIDERPEFSRMSVEHPARPPVNCYLKDAKTVNSHDDSIRSKSNEARDHSEVVFRKSIGSDLSSLHLYGTTTRREPFSERLPPSFRKKSLRDETTEAKDTITMDVGPLMGLGRYCSWRKAKDNTTGFLITLCEIEKYAIQCSNLQPRLEIEMGWYNKLFHQNIIQFYATFEDSKKRYFIFEAGEQTLGSYIRNMQSKGEKLSEREALRILKDILAGLQNLHEECRLVHGALSPDKIMLVAGTSKIFDLSYAEESEPKGRPPSDHAPILIRSRRSGGKSKQRDCWNVGMIAYFMLAGHSEQPIEFEDLQKLYGQDLHLPQLSSSHDYWCLVHSFLQPQPSHRLTAKQALQLPLLIL